MAPEEMRAMYQRWQAESKENVGSMPHFLKWLVAQQYVTEYQATLLQKGQADDFFLGPYKILDRIGRGRMAGVYKAMHTLSMQVVAIKVLPPSRAKNVQVLGRFEREARLSLKLKHPNVVRSFQVGEARGLHWLVMEHLEGETLEEVLARRRKLPPHEAVRLIHQALLGLQHIHEMGMVHRDLKPANLMLASPAVAPKGDVTDQATVKILDIGLARSMFDEEDKTELTAEGVLLGTPDYLSPEQARDPRSSDIRADIYSLGCVLYHALTGQPPFPDKNILNQMIRHATETPKPIREFNPQVPEGLEQIIGYMMAKDPAKRYPTPERAALGLQVFMVADAAPAVPLEETPQLRKYLTSLELDPVPAAAPAKPVSNPVAQAAPTPQPAPPASNPVVQAGPARVIPPKPPTAHAMPVAPPPPASTPMLASAPKDDKASKTAKAKRKVKAKNIPVGKPAGAPPGTAGAVFTLADPDDESEDVDVELIPEVPIPWKLWDFSRRDWILVGYGAALTTFLGLFVFSLSLLFRRSEPIPEGPSDGAAKEVGTTDGKAKTDGP
ncbi:MAG: serine/threonine-protein kinase [Gemmataceae bacterium]